MPGNHGEILVDEQSKVDNDNKKTRKKKKDVKDIGIEYDFENKNRLEMPLISKNRKRILSKIRKKSELLNRCSSPSCSFSRRESCFCVMRPRRTEEEEEDQCSSSSSSSSSSLSDPNDENFTSEMLRGILECNDFFSNDCNPHR